MLFLQYILLNAEISGKILVENVIMFPGAW
jgi:hypothetical protein